MEFGKILKNERTKNNLTQSDLALKLHVARQTISKWETGESYPNLDVLLSISEILDVPTDVLLKGENNTVAETISKDVKNNKIYQRIAWTGIGGGLIVILLLGVLTWGRATQNIWVDRFNPFLKTQYGYALIGNQQNTKTRDALVISDPFGNGEYLKFETGMTFENRTWALVQHKGSYVYRTKLITPEQLPLTLQDWKNAKLSKNFHYDRQIMGPRNSWNPFE